MVILFNFEILKEHTPQEKSPPILIYNTFVVGCIKDSYIMFGVRPG